MTTATTTWIAIVGAGQAELPYRATIDRIPDAEILLFAKECGDLLKTTAGKVDAVVVADPVLDPTELAVLAKPVFLPHTSSASIANLAEVFELSPTNISVGMPLRFRSDIAAVKESLDAGQLGVPGLLRIHCWRQPDGANDRGLIDEIDLIRWFFGSSPRSIYAVGRSINAPDDYIQVHLGFPSGGMAMIDVNSALPPGDSYQALSLIGSDGAAYADDHHNMQLVYQGDHPVAVRTEASGDVLLAELAAFVDSVRTTQKLHFDADAWQATMAVAKAVDASKQSGRAVHLVEEAYELT